jgi:hypothetical protein
MTIYLVANGLMVAKHGKVKLFEGLALALIWPLVLFSMLINKLRGN